MCEGGKGRGIEGRFFVAVFFFFWGGVFFWGGGGESSRVGHRPFRNLLLSFPFSLPRPVCRGGGGGGGGGCF